MAEKDGQKKSTLPALPFPFSFSRSTIPQERRIPLLRARDKSKAFANKVVTLIKVGANPCNTSHLAFVSPASQQFALAQVASAFNQESASNTSFTKYKDDLKLLNGEDNQTRLQIQQVRGRNQLSASTTARTKDFQSSILQTANATLETPRPPEPALPAFDYLQARKKELDETFGLVKKQKARKWRKALDDEKQAYVQKILQQPGQISDLPGANCEARDIRKLRPRQWINDEIVTFYTVLINNRSLAYEKHPEEFPDQERFLRVHCFNSFFMGKYDKDGYDGVKRWSKKTDLLQKDVIIFPINIKNAHWTCAAINLRCKRFEYFDSMSNPNQSVLANLRDYIVNEALAKKKITLDVSDWPDCFYEDIPQQNNSFDCGIFVCQFMDCLSRDWSTTQKTTRPPNQSAITDLPPSKERETLFDFGQENMEYIRSKMIYEIASKRFLDEEWA